MTLLETAIAAFERLPLPDPLSRATIAALVGRTARRLDEIDADAAASAEAAFALNMARFPIATHVAEANAQHYELPAAFFEAMLGPARKYSCGFWEPGALAGSEAGLASSERAGLELTVAHAELRDGQRILELGCGWGSLTLYMAARFPCAEIVAVSNSASQRRFIEEQAAARGLGNLRVAVADMNVFKPEGRFDRVVSVEMFEHMANWQALLERVRDWLLTDGKLFLHVFTHRATPYRFDHRDPADWIARHFFTGGIMPSQGLAHCFPDLFRVEAEWRWDGTHYAHTARAWLTKLDREQDRVIQVLRKTYGTDAILWLRRWRLFLLATEGLFRHGHGQTWGVGHYRLVPLALPNA